MPDDFLVRIHPMHNGGLNRDQAARSFDLDLEVIIASG